MATVKKATKNKAASTNSAAKKTTKETVAKKQTKKTAAKKQDPKGFLEMMERGMMTPPFGDSYGI